MKSYCLNLWRPKFGVGRKKIFAIKFLVPQLTENPVSAPVLRPLILSSEIYQGFVFFSSTGFPKKDARFSKLKKS